MKLAIAGSSRCYQGTFVLLRPDSGMRSKSRSFLLAILYDPVTRIKNFLRKVILLCVSVAVGSSMLNPGKMPCLEMLNRTMTKIRDGKLH